MLRNPGIRIFTAFLALIWTGFLPLATQAQTNPDDYYLGHGFSSGDTVYTNSGTFWDAGGLANYGAGENWYVIFCATNGNPITVDFSGFATHYGGIPPPTPPWTDYDYMSINYPGANYVAYHDDTPEFSFTSQNGCIRFGFISQPVSPTHNGWEAEIYAIPAPANNDPCGAAVLTVGNVCSPQVFSNKGAYETGFGSTPCHTFFGGDVWFSAQVPSSGQLKIESFPGTLEWAVMSLYTGTCGSLSYMTCIEDSLGMPTAHLTGRTPGETIYIRMFGDQAKSGTFGMCASDPEAQIDGHTGPGGVGDDSTNVLWLRADMGVLNNTDSEASNGEAVKIWKDQSGNGNFVKQYNGSSQPQLSSNVINGMPVVRLDGTDDYMFDSLGSLSAPLTLISVGRFTSSASDDYMLTIGDDLGNVKTVSISRENDDRYYAFTDNGKHYGPGLNDNTPCMIHAVHNIASAYHELYINETTQSPVDYTTSVVTNGSFFLGTSKYLGNFLGGDVAELIIYDKKLNSAQKIIVENFLAAKYGISVATDKYAWEGTHGYDVAGIGQVDATSQHTEAESARTLSIGNPTDLDNGEFILFGHDNGDIDSWTGTERPNDDANLQRIAREWRVNISGGDPGSLTISLSDSILPATPVGFNTYNIWVDGDGDFSTGAVAIPLVRVNEHYIANTVNLADGDYITVGTAMPVVNFSLTSSSNLESVPDPEVEVSLNYAVNEEIGVVFWAEDGTASGDNLDYLLNAGMATFAAGEKTVYIEPLIVDDTIVELPDEYFRIILQSPDPGLNLGADTIHTFTILNNDIEVTAGTDRDTIGACGTTIANLNTTVLGTGPYIYAWTPVDSLSDPAIANPVADPSSSTLYKVTVTDQTNGAVGVDSVYITVQTGPAKPIITPGGPVTFCDGDSVLLSSSPGFSYLWTTGGTSQDIYVKTIGKYTVRVIDEFGCESESSDTVNITVNALPVKPVITGDGPTTFCEGDSVDLTSDEGFAYLWSNGETTRTIRVKNPGKFAVQVTSPAGCESPTSDTVEIIVNSLPAKPSITPGGPTTVCEGDSVDLSSDAASGYLWSTGASTRTIRVKATGKYAVQVLNPAGCYSPTSDTITVTVQAAPSKPTISYTGSTTICSGDSLVLDAPAASSYLWSTGETAQSITVKTTGSFTVIIFNAAGCPGPVSDQVDVKVNLLPAKPIISGAQGYCEGDSAQLDGPAADSYLWSTGATTASIYVKSGSYTLLVSDATGCISPASDPFTVTEHSLPPKPLISGNTDYCEGSSTDLTSSLADNYAWSTGATTRTITVTLGQYWLNVTDLNACMSENSDTVTVTVLPKPPKPFIIAGGPVDFWLGDSVILSSSAAASYTWMPGGQTSQDITVKDSGDYSVITGDANGCLSDPSDIQTVVVRSLARPSITVTGGTDYCEGESLTTLISSPGDTYLWSNGQTTRDILVTQSGSYSVTISDSQGHPSTPSDPVVVTINPVPTGSLLSTVDVTCHGESTGAAELDASGGTIPYFYYWDSGHMGSQEANLPAAEYMVILSDANHCVDTIFFSIVEPEAIDIQESIIHPFCADSEDGSVSVSISGGTPGYALLWSDGSAGNSLSDLPTGSVSVTVTDAGFCQVSESYDLLHANSDCILIPEIITPNNDGFNDSWQILGLEYYSGISVEVYDRWGKRVFFSQGYDIPWDGTFDGRELPMASYHYVIKINKDAPPMVGNITIVR